ncbi:MAG TPA: hypothetical protein VG345_16515 [Bryobacteraceae bacterium]|jgi:hypothetical protein|nr:hypothetical protein [Bryobacteraceae bacterium]
MKTRKDIAAEFDLTELAEQIEVEKLCQLADLNENFAKLLKLLETLSKFSPLSLFTGKKP